MLRLLLSPKWMAWHVLTLGAMVTCGFLSAWQWHRAGSAMGSALNVGYGVQWPIFAVFFGAMWWRFLRMELRALDAPATDAPAVRPDSEPPVPGPVASPETASPELPPAAPGAATAVPVPRPETDERPSPFTPRPAGAEPSRHVGPARRAYNEALAELAARDQET